jgi:DNA-binding IclR family transcriptional regulator
VRTTAATHLARLNQSTGHTVHLGAYEDGKAIYIDKYESRHPVRMSSRVGLRLRLHCTAMGKVLLAGLPLHPGTGRHPALRAASRPAAGTDRDGPRHLRRLRPRLPRSQLPTPSAVSSASTRVAAANRP